MKLVIVRHAIAEDRDPAAWPEDGLRPLTERGRSRFSRAALGIGRLVPEVDLVLSSPYVRAWDTAMILAKQAGWPKPEACDELQDSPPETVIGALEAYKDLDTVAVVGHEPHLGRLIGYLVSPSVSLALELRKGAAACIDISAGETRLLWLLQPKALRMLA